MQCSLHLRLCACHTEVPLHVLFNVTQIHLRPPNVSVHLQRFCSQVSMMFATQSLLYALGIGATKTVAASAAVNWMLKEGLGKLARMGVATSYASNFDSDLKVLDAHLFPCPPPPTTHLRLTSSGIASHPPKLSPCWLASYTSHIVR